ncbi:hypothetical protein HLB35_00055 [Halomonas sp. TBZ9]|uniref:Uncharacterized protein n=1 Tax=Vreelandella azerica TaxID=2732867 RepID=A0A7Y3X9S0_9GAMM|nr:hypothetical protein [Halomonas azerica]NOG30556.1 hypothetical protein [Halomonas azerica]
MNGVVDQAFVDRNITPSMQEVEGAANQLEKSQSTENDLNEDEIKGLIAMREQLQSERTQIIEQINSREKVLEELQAELSTFIDRVEELEEQMGTIEKLNVFSREDEYVQASAELEEAASLVEQAQAEHNELTAQLNALDEDIKNTTDMIEGNNVNEGWLTSMRNKMSEFRDMARWERIVTTVEDVIPSLLNLMAAFLFKTLIMPLIFLALFLKGFKYIWGVDPRKWAQDEYAKMKKVED